MTKNQSIIFIITGKTGSGKTTFLDRLIKILRKHDISISGFLSKRSKTQEHEQVYELYLFDSHQIIPFASRVPVEGWINIANFYFNPEALKRGNGIISDSQILNKDLVVVDEIGIFELEGKMWADAISHLVSKSDKMMIWVVRDTLIEKVIEKWNLQKPVIIDIQKVSIRQAEEKILSMFEIH